ncbi:MAG TPA: endonuclease/exonuclease/phosphatase family protein [Micromonosporaceae bacterium]|nr:endonuclease/exonuclease/phosphatase family protein [Micromonosporaceae bacterium]
MDPDTATTDPQPPVDPSAADASPSPVGAHDAPTSHRNEVRRSGRRRFTTPVCWTLASLLAAFAIMRVFGLERTWFLSTPLVFTPYVAGLGILFVGLALVARRWWASAVATAAVTALVWGLVPLAVGSPNPGPGPTLHVLSSNMKIGAADPATILGLARQHLTDVLALDEYTPEAQAALAAAGINAMFPYSAQTPIYGAVGSAIFSRYPIRDTGYRHLAGGYGQEFATVVVPGALPVLIEAVHTAAPVGPSAESIWNGSIDQEPPASPHGAVRLLIGDFNSTLDQHRLRTLLATGYRDVAAQVGQGLDTTWPYDGRPIPPVTLDHMFADPRIGVIRFGSGQVPGTDHKAIYATLTLPVG